MTAKKDVKKEEKPPEKEAKKEEKKAEEKKEVEKIVKSEAKEEKKPKKKTTRKRSTKKKAKGPKGKIVIARGKRKESQARARIKKGTGEIKINSNSVKVYGNKYLRSIITEPLSYMGPEVNELDISISVKGGGIMGQAQAARTAIAKALVIYFDKENLKEKFISIDRSLLVEDARRVESKKYRGPKARARYQKSYR